MFVDHSMENIMKVDLAKGRIQKSVTMMVIDAGLCIKFLIWPFLIDRLCFWLLPVTFVVRITSVLRAARSSARVFGGACRESLSIVNADSNIAGLVETSAGRVSCSFSLVL